MIDLITRIEQATGPDRQLDGAIWVATTADPTPQDYALMFEKEYGRPMSDVLRAIFEESWAYSFANPPRYTDSLDVALLLVPAGWTWTIEHQWDNEYYGAARLTPSESGRPSYDARAKTPVLALCAAALRSRS